MSSKRRGTFLRWRRSDRSAGRHRDGREDDVAAARAAIEDALRRTAAAGDAVAAKQLREWLDARAAREVRARLDAGGSAAERELIEGISRGAEYDLNIELGPRSDERLLAACVALWSDPSLDGPYLDPTRRRDEQAKVAPALIQPLPEDDWATAADQIGLSHLPAMYGVATLPDGNRVGCASCDFREESLLRPAKDLRDELSFSISLGALETVYEIDWSAHQTGNFESWRSWAAPLQEWLADIAQTIYRAVPFRLAAIGEEAGCVMPTASEITAAGGPERFREQSPLTSCLFPAEDGSLKWYPSDW